MVATTLTCVDVVVVGMGVAGTLVAKELAQTGLRVVGLERGRNVDPRHEFAMPGAHDELKFGKHSNLVQNLARETLAFRNHAAETALPMRETGSFMPGECVGGAARIPADCTSRDWGITYDELEPYYGQFEHIYGICGKAGNIDGALQPGGNPFEGALMHESFELRALANVTKVNLDASGKRAVSVTYVDAQGREWEQPAELVILTSFTLDNTPARTPDGIGRRLTSPARRLR